LILEIALRDETPSRRFPVGVTPISLLGNKERGVKNLKQLILTVTFLLVIATSANAQEKGRKGLVIAYPTSFGFIWNVTDWIAIRPDVSFTKAESESPASSPDIDSNSFETGFSALFYVKKWQNVAVYLTPRFSYSRSKTTNNVLTGGSTVNWSYPSSASFGVQYALSERFAVFGEAGVEYSRFHSGSPFSTFPVTKTWRSKSGVGVNFYF